MTVEFHTIVNIYMLIKRWKYLRAFPVQFDKWWLCTYCSTLIA